MQYLSFVNLSCSEPGIFDFTKTAYVFWICETVLLVISYFVMFYCYYLLLGTSQYHKNLSYAFCNYATQYLVSLSSRIGIIIMQLTYPAETLKNNSLFNVLTVIRTLCLLTCFINKSALVFERSMATYFVEDYEPKKRLWIPLSTIPVIYICSATLTVLYVTAYINSFVLVAVLISINLLNLLISCLTEQYTLHIHRQLIRPNSNFSLTTRYQQCENIKSWELLRMVIVSICIFNFILSICIVIQESYDDYLGKNYAALTFDFAAVLYGLIVPCVCLFYNKIWQRVLLRHLQMIGCVCVKSDWVVPEAMNTQGHNMIIDASRHQQQYFQQLSRVW